MSKSKHVESTFSVHPQNVFNTRRTNGAFDFVSKMQNLFCRRMLWDRQLLQHSFLICAEYCLPVILLSMMLLSLWSVWLQGCLWKGVEAAKENEAWTFMANSNIPFPAVCPEYCCFSFSFQMDQTQSFQLICQFPTIACWNSFNIWIQIWCTRMRNYNVFCHKHVIFPHFIFYWPGIKFIWLVIIQFSLALLKCKDNQLFSFCLLFCILPCLLFCSLFWFVWLGVLVVKC